MEKKILEEEQVLLRYGVRMGKIEEIERFEEIEKNEESEKIEESCGTLWHYIVHQTVQIPLGVQLEVQACRVFGIQRHMNTRIWTRTPSL